MLNKLRQRARDEKGFTLIELLVVILIIGILAAIAIPVFLNQRKKGVDASIKSDLKNMATLQETYMTDNPTVALLGTGLCGALTTYSTFGFETVRLLADRARTYAVLNVAASVVAGLGAAFCGTAVAQALWS